MVPDPLPLSDSRQPLPFEPTTRRRQKNPKKTAPAQASSPRKTAAAQARPSPSERKAQRGIPDDVSRRMLRRMFLFCGVPSFLGISSIIASYFVVSRQVVILPPTAVLLVSLGFLGLGVLGLSYGVLSTSWDTGRSGSFWGWREFIVNWQRMTGAWRAARAKTGGR